MGEVGEVVAEGEAGVAAAEAAHPEAGGGAEAPLMTAMQMLMRSLMLEETRAQLLKMAVDRMVHRILDVTTKERMQSRGELSSPTLTILMFFRCVEDLRISKTNKYESDEAPRLRALHIH